MNTKRIAAVTACAIVFCAMCSFSQGQGRFGVGMVFGEPTGVAWKYRMNNSNAVDGAIGFEPNNNLRVHADYLWQSHPFDERRLSVHYGLGAAFGDTHRESDRDMGFAARGVVGLTYLVSNSPIDMFFEVAPLMIFTPDPGSDLDIGLGGRFYF